MEHHIQPYGPFHAEQVDDGTSVAGQIFSQLACLEKIRKSEKAFVCQADTWTVDTFDSSVLCIGRYYEGEKILGLFNFSFNTLREFHCIYTSP
mgnify:CR=1 FL=1